MAHGIERKLTTILAADVEGYSRLMEADEAGALVALRESRAVFARLIERHRGRIANTAGDGLIADFPSVVEAVRCAAEVQTELAARNRREAADRAMNFRIGVHLGDVMVDGGDLFGEGVNLAARLQAMAEPGGVLISQAVYDQVRSKLAIGYEALGQRRPKNLADPVTVYRLLLDGVERAAGASNCCRTRRELCRRRQPTPARPICGRGVVRLAQRLAIVWAGPVRHRPVERRQTMVGLARHRVPGRSRPAGRAVAGAGLARRATGPLRRDRGRPGAGQSRQRLVRALVSLARGRGAGRCPAAAHLASLVLNGDRRCAGRGETAASRSLSIAGRRAGP